MKTQTTAMKAPKTVIYLGPKISGAAEPKAIYNNGLPKTLSQLADKSLAIQKLIIPVDELKEASKALDDPSSLLSHYYKQAENELKGVLQK